MNFKKGRVLGLIKKNMKVFVLFFLFNVIVIRFGCNSFKLFEIKK